MMIMIMMMMSKGQATSLTDFMDRQMCNEENDAQQTDRMTQKDEQTDKFQTERLTNTRQTNSDQWINGQTQIVSRLYDKKSTGDLKVRIRFGEYMTWLGLFSSFEVLVWG